MNELSQGFLGTLALSIALVYSLFAWFGGRDQNYLKIRARIWGRVIAPLFLSLATISLAVLARHFSWWFFLSVPSMIISHTIGYGGDKLWTKILRRTIWSLMRSACALPFVLITHSWVLFGAQLGVSLLITLTLGIAGVLAAPQEEGLIKFSAVFLVPFYVL